MTTDRYDNDPAIQITADGGDLSYSGGQPLMDQGGLENAVIISLFTAEGWVGNALENNPDRMIGSDFYKAQGVPITSSSVRDMERSAERALEWAVNIGLAREVNATVYATHPKRIRINIEIIQIDDTSVEFEYDLNWTASRNQEEINNTPTIPIVNLPPVPVSFEYYLDSSALEGGDGTIESPYGELTDIDWGLITTRTAQGDTISIRLKRGSVWSGSDAGLVIGASGGETNPLTIEPYGEPTDDKPQLYQSTADEAVLATDKEYIILDGIWVKEPDLGGIRFEGLSKNNTFRNNYVERTTIKHGFAIVGTASDPTTGNVFYNNFSAKNGDDLTSSRMRGAFFSYCDDSHIYENEMYWNEGQGLYFSNCSGNTIEDNYLFSNGGAGIYCSLFSSNTIRRNRFLESGARVLDQGHITLGTSSSNNKVYMNHLEQGFDYGIIIRNTGSENNVIYNNTVVATYRRMAWQYDSGINNVFKNNILWNENAIELNFMRAVDTPQVFDYNIYWSPDNILGVNTFVYGGGLLDWAVQWNPANDPNGYYADPLLTYFLVGSPELTELWVQAGSPAIGNAEPLTGYEDRLDPTSKWILFDELTGEIVQASDVKTIEDPSTIGAYAYVP